MALQLEKVDIVAKDYPQEKIGFAVTQALALKGFCVLRPDVHEAYFENVLSDIARLETEERFSQPPTMIVEGLLGLQGSAKICELDAPEAEAAARTYGENIQHFDNELTQLGLKIVPYLMGSIGVEVVTRTAGVLHQAGMPADEGPELTGDTCAKWIQTFAHHRIMTVWCLGPEKGTLELQPFDDDCGQMTVPMEPGTLVILRPDALRHSFSAIGKAYCLTTFYQKEGLHHKHRRGPDRDTTPCCAALEEWAQALMKEYKESMPEEQARMALPRHWESLANHTSFVGQHIAVRTASTRQVGAWDPVNWTSAFQAGPDYVVEIPIFRWNHDFVYDEDPEGYTRFKTNCRHGAFIDGTELFDNTLFRISKAEAQGMDPGHRLTMETGYEALVRDGYKISKLMNSKGGVYIANPPADEWGMTDKDVTGGGVCGGGGSIACGRFSFTHGMKGPCISIDVEGASSLVALNFAATNLSRTGNWDPIPFALCSSWNLSLNPRPLIFASSRKVLCPVGRTFCFDASACGYVRGDCVVSLVLKAFTEIVDGDVVVNDKDAFLGALAGTATNQSGQRASLTAPDGAAFQEVIFDAIRQADISPLDVDAVDVYADGSILHEAIEAAATAKACRPEGMHNVQLAAPLGLQASKGPGGNQIEAGGLCSVVKVMIGAQFGSMYPNAHLRILNPHMDLDLCERPTQVLSEALEFGLESCYTGITNRSMVGTNCHVICWGQLTSDGKTAETEDDEAPLNKIMFWPEGGGDLDVDQLPKRSYNIVGSWNRWQPQAMEQDTTGVYTFVMTLGENRWERFQIALDGNTERVLYPEYDGLASKGAPVCGPKAAFRSESWLLDGRDYGYAEGLQAIGDGSEATAPLMAPGAEDLGKPGDRYLIRLRVKGKFRAVDWEKLTEEEPAPYPQGSYQLVGSWFYSNKQDLYLDRSRNVFSTEVQLPRDGGGYFQIIREHDWGQVLYPAWEWADQTAPCLGPDEAENNYNAWVLQGKKGDVFRVEFQRDVQPSTDVDEKTVTWTWLRRDPVSPDVTKFLSTPQFFVAGMWDYMKFPLRMNWTGNYYQFFIQLGYNKRESFQIYRDGNPAKCFWPSENDANPYDKHKILGPDVGEYGRCWTVGLHEGDEAEYGKRYEIRLRLDEEEKPEKVDWVQVRSMDGLEDAKGRGYILIGE